MGFSLAWPLDSKGGIRRLASLAGCLLVPVGTAPAQVYLTEAELPRALFPTADSTLREELLLTPGLKDSLRQLLGGEPVTLWNDTIPLLRAFRRDSLVGYGVVVEEIGKARPITFAVEVNPAGQVGQVLIMAYREPRGGEVRMERFLRQYRGKGLTDSLRLRREVKNITGATLSVRAVTRGVREALALIHHLQRTSPSRP